MNKGHQITTKRITIISILIIVGILLTMLIISIYVNNQSDDLLAITFACTTGIKPNAHSAFRVYDNGTHRIDMDSCGWIPNSNYKSVPGEYQKIHKMSCSEIIERHATGIPYQNNRNKAFAEAKISSCDFVDRWEEAQKKVDNWGIGTFNNNYDFF